MASIENMVNFSFYFSLFYVWVHPMVLWCEVDILIFKIGYYHDSNLQINTLKVVILVVTVGGHTGHIKARVVSYYVYYVTILHVVWGYLVSRPLFWARLILLEYLIYCIWKEYIFSREIADRDREIILNLKLADFSNWWVS